MAYEFDPNGIFDPRNISDDLKGKSHEDIRKIVHSRRKGYCVILSNVQYDLNVGQIIRSSNAFSANKVILYGKKKYDRRATVGTHLYIDILHAPDIGILIEMIKEFTPIAIETGKDAIAVDDFQYPPSPALVFGNESTGIPDEVLNLCKTKIHIPQLGTVRSLNVASAAAIVMHDFVRKTK